MNNKKKFFKRVISMMLVLTLIITTMQVNQISYADIDTDIDTDALTNSVSENDYSLMALEENIILNVDSAVINGAIYSKGDFTYDNKDIQITDTAPASGNIVFPNLLTQIRDSLMDCAIYDDEEFYNGSTFQIEKNTIYNDSVSINSAMFAGQNTLLAANDISIRSSMIETNLNMPLIMVSENGNIDISASKTSYNGVIYAPNGYVRINSSEINFYGKIIAKQIIIEGNVLNIEGNNINLLDEIGYNYATEDETQEALDVLFLSQDDDTYEVDDMQYSIDILDDHRMALMINNQREGTIYDKNENAFYVDGEKSELQIAVVKEPVSRANLTRASYVPYTSYKFSIKKLAGDIGRIATYVGLLTLGVGGIAKASITKVVTSVIGAAATVVGGSAQALSDLATFVDFIATWNVYRSSEPVFNGYGRYETGYAYGNFGITAKFIRKKTRTTFTVKRTDPSKGGWWFANKPY